MAAVQFIAKWLDRTVRFIAMAALFVLAMLTAVDVGGRTFFDSPIGFTFELAGVLLGLAIYAGLVSMNWRRNHVKIDLLAGAFARVPAIEKLRDRLSWVLEVTFFAVLAAMVLRQALAVARWNERFLFLPTEKWVPMMAFFVLLSTAIAIFALHVLRVSPDKGDDE